MKVTVVNYANSNANSILRALAAIGVTADFSEDARDIAESDFIILPGVGHTGTALASLRHNGLVTALEDAVLGRGVRILGICLGMQIMVNYVEEGDCAGLGWIGGKAVRLSVDDRIRYKVPHIGWTSVVAASGSALMPAAAATDPFFYFCHKYTVEDVDGADVISKFDYERPRVAIFEKGNIFGVQFHPEKSHTAGQALFRRFFGLA